MKTTPQSTATCICGHTYEEHGCYTHMCQGEDRGVLCPCEAFTAPPIQHKSNYQVLMEQMMREQAGRAL